MDESEGKEITSTQDIDNTTIAAEIPVDDMRGVFRLLFAGDNSLSELYAGPVVVTPKDICELNDKIIDKLRHYETHGIAFSAVASYENNRSREYGSWEKFCDEDWTSPDVLESMSIWWKFLIRFPDSHKPVLHSIHLRISSSMKPQYLLQAVFSKDPEELEKIDFKMVPISCRIDFVDHILSTLIRKYDDVLSRYTL